MSDSESDHYASDGSDDDDFAFLDEGEKGEKKKTTKAAPKKKAETKKKETATKTKSTKEKEPKTKEKKETKTTKAKTTTKKKEDDDDDMEVDEESTAKKRGPAKKKTVEETYKKLDQIEHALQRPDMYIGSAKEQEVETWVFDKDEGLNYRKVSYVPGLYKIFDEILVNAADNKQRDDSMDYIKVEIDEEKNTISVENDGAGIPVVIHEVEKIYVPELIFGHLLTGSSFDDTVKKVVGGRNGLGAKLANIFSTEFIVETIDSENGKKFKQVFSNNMGTKGKPTVAASKSKSMTKITFTPDLQRFGMLTLDKDILALMKKRVYDLAGTNPKLKVHLNGERIRIKNFTEYCKMFLKDDKKPAIFEDVNDRWQICVSVSDGDFMQVSYVNSICTSRGGTHVNHVWKKISKELLTAANKKAKKDKLAELKPAQIKNHVALFINCLIENPSFDSQTKETLMTQEKEFGSKCDISEETLKKICKSAIIDAILAFSRNNSDKLLSKAGGKKKKRITGLAKLDDANDAGGRNAADCTLILTEGDSAKTLAVSGISVVGRDKYGVFPLRGKLLNVRDATLQQVLKNEEIAALQQILGLKYNSSYTGVKDLRYGHLMIMTDQDQDGSHIKGLIINYLHKLCPDLLKIPGFLNEFITPIVKAKKGKQVKAFFTMPEYRQWKEEIEQKGEKGWEIRYFKGLGTSTSQEAREYFAEIDKHQIDFKWTGQEDSELIDMAFNKARAEDRKEWMRKYEPGTYLDHHALDGELPYNEFINKELILFSLGDCDRSIPSVVDGFKPGQRKILFSCFKKNLKKDVKVGELAGYVSENSAYHHGEASLHSTIIGMAQNYIGSNNLNTLVPSGSFGTRRMGGKDHASARYIFTRLNLPTRAVFHKDDDTILEQQIEEGKSIEPKWYIPVLPMVLVNGAAGIGTGWSTDIPTYNPEDIVENLKRLIKDEKMEPMHPWYRGYKGTIIWDEKKKNYRVAGVWEVTSDGSDGSEESLEITELPVGTWTQNYKEFLESLLTGTDKKAAILKDYKEYHTDTTVKFCLEFLEGKMPKSATIEKDLKLSTTISTTNLVAFDPEGRIKKYESVEQIMEEFYTLRLTYYQNRKDYLIKSLTNDWTKLDNKCRFIMMVIKEEIIVRNRKKAELLKELEQKGFDKFDNKTTKKKTEEIDDDDDEDETEKADSSSGYNYLLSMALWNLTYERYQKLLKERDAKQAEIDVLVATTTKQIWVKDLDDFLVQYKQWKEDTEAAEQDIPKPKRGTAKKRGGAAGSKRKVKEEDDDEFESSKPKAKTQAVKKGVKAEVKVEPKKEIKKDTATTTATKKTETKKDTASNNTKIDSFFAKKSTNSAPVKESKQEVSDDEELSLSERLALKKAATSTATTSKKTQPVELSDDEDNNNKRKKVVVPKKTTATAAKKTATKEKKPTKSKAKKDESDEEEEAQFSDSDDDVMEIEKPKSTATTATSSRSTRAKAPVKYDLDEESEDEDDDDDDGGDESGEDSD